MKIMERFRKITTIVNTLGELRDLRSHDHWSPKGLREHQDRAFGALRRFACQRSLFYQEFHRGLEDAPLSELPVLTKSMIMDQFDEFVTDSSVHLADVRRHVEAGSVGRFNGRYEVVTTSGSTGNPGIFLFDPKEWMTIIASFAKAWEWAGQKVDLTKRSKMAVVSSTNDKNLSAKVARAADTLFIPTLRLDATAPMVDIVRGLNGWNPETLVAYASMAHFLAEEQKAGNLQIAPKKVFTSSEVLTPQMRRTIEGVWGNIVFNEYASTETASIAAEDEGHHGMHVFEDLLIVENVDANNKPVPDGEFGDKILVSILFSRTQPLIRYEISDSIRFAARQPDCRLPYKVINGVQGRREDIISIAGAQIHPNVFHDVMDIVPNKGWQVVQEKNGLRILLVDPQTDLQAVRRQVSEALSAKGAEVLEITIETVEAIPKAKSGKSPLIKAYKNAPQ
jgi:phenylacetate-CoA ligase